MKRATKNSIYAIPSITGYAIRDDGEVLATGAGNSLREIPVAKVTFSQAMQILGNRIALHRTPFPLVAGVWQMCFAPDVGTNQWLGTVSVSRYLRKHGFGPNRVHPSVWPGWPDAANAAAENFVDESAREWCVLSHLTRDSERLRTHVNDFDLPIADLLRAPVIILAPVALAAIRSKLTAKTE